MYLLHLLLLCNLLHVYPILCRAYEILRMRFSYCVRVSRDLFVAVQQRATSAGRVMLSSAQSQSVMSVCDTSHEKGIQ